MYRVAYNLAPEPISDMYKLANNVHNYNTRYASDGNVYINRPNTTKGQRSINFSGARVWSRVPATIKEAQSLVLFKTQLKEYLLDKEQLTQMAVSWRFIFKPIKTETCNSYPYQQHFNKRYSFCCNYVHFCFHINFL